MKRVYKSTTRIFSAILVITLIFTAFPTSAFAAIDEPLSGVTGSGWEDFGGLSGEEEIDTPPVTAEPPDDDNTDVNRSDGDNPDNAAVVESES